MKASATITVGMMIGLAIGLAIGLEAVGYSDIAELKATLTEMNNRQQRVVKQHEEIYSGVTAVHQAVEEMKGGAR